MAPYTDLDSSDGGESGKEYHERFEGFILRVKDDRDDDDGWKKRYHPNGTKDYTTLTYSPTINETRQRYNVQVVACVSSNNPYHDPEIDGSPETLVLQFSEGL